MRFGTKAQTLKGLYGRLQRAEVLPAAIFTAWEWKESPEKVYASLMREPWAQESELIVRSSAINEDLQNESMAGKFESVAHVRGKARFFEAVKTVLASYGEDENPENQFFAQPMLTDAAMAGVAFTLDPSTGGNYYVLNYDDTTGSTSSVTSGRGAQLKTFYRFKGFEGATEYPELDRVIEAAEELERLFETDTLDIEFAVTKAGGLYILQVRPLVIKRERRSQAEQKAILNRIHEYIRRADGPKPYLYGDRAIYSVMTDWNPAEIIGVRPKPLALSLYKNLITDGEWAYQRKEYGYKDLRSFPLIIDYGGCPYIDVRVSFNSFVPQTIDDALAQKLVDYYLNRLIEHPQMHDKVEFDIIFSCHTFDLPERIKTLEEHGFSKDECEEILKHLNSLTRRIINNKDGLWVVDSRKINILKERQEAIIGSDYSKIYKIYWLLEDCRRYGTLPFAGLARAGFIAVQLLKSLVNMGVFTQAEYDEYMASLNTVSSNMARDFHELSRQAFLKKYGHLRPGTYDICSPRYDEAPERYFQWDGASEAQSERPEFKLTITQMTKIRGLLKDCGWVDDILVLFEFLKGAIEGREYSKFVFTKSLSWALKLLEELGKEYGISREDMAYVNIDIVKTLYNSERNVEETLRLSIEEGKRRYHNTQGLVMPPVITRADDCRYFHLDESVPNYITLCSASGPVRTVDDEDLEGAILFIPSADPGYDWIFSRRIAGFVTKYGGANSHMAIRSGELSIPAIVGAGEKLYERLSSAKVVEINCALRRADILQ